MKRKIPLILCMLVLIAYDSLAQQNPIVYILATGGTIAGVGASETSSGYSSGVVSVDEIIASAPEILNLAEVKGEQVINIPSQDITVNDWIIIALIVLSL